VTHESPQALGKRIASHWPCVPNLIVALSVALSACGGRSKQSADDGSLSGGAVGGQPAGTGGAAAGRGGQPEAEPVLPLTDEPGAPPAVTELGPIPDAAEPLWRETLTPLCIGSEPLAETASVWSESAAVFLMTGASDGTHSVHRNGGDGWTLWGTWSRSAPERRISGIPGIAVLDFGGEARCGIHQLTPGGGETCFSASGWVFALHVVKEDLAYAAAEGHLLTWFDGSYWKQWGDPVPLSHGEFDHDVWASEQRTTTAGRVLEFAGGSPTPPAPMSYELGQPPTDVWGHGATTWVATATGELWRSNGADYQRVWVASENAVCDGIRGLWGAADGELFVYTKSSLWRINDNQIRALADFGCDGSVEITGVWGNSSSEVFVSLLNGDPDCGAASIAWFDGESLRPL
jgi:hypothetical protein